MRQDKMNESTGISVVLNVHEWNFVKDAINAWTSHVMSLTPTDETADSWADMANDAQRLEVILNKIRRQTD